MIKTLGAFLRQFIEYGIIERVGLPCLTQPHIRALWQSAGSRGLPEWLEVYYGLDRATSPDAAYQAASLAETANPRDGTVAGGRLSAWESHLWNLDPTNSSQYAHAEIEVVDGAPRVRIVPSSPNRTYTLLGKDSLNAQNWARSPDLSDADFLFTNRFFKVSVELK